MKVWSQGMTSNFHTVCGFTGCHTPQYRAALVMCVANYWRFKVEWRLLSRHVPMQVHAQCSMKPVSWSLAKLRCAYTLFEIPIPIIPSNLSNMLACDLYLWHICQSISIREVPRCIEEVHDYTARPDGEGGGRCSKYCCHLQWAP